MFKTKINKKAWAIPTIFLIGLILLGLWYAGSKGMLGFMSRVHLSDYYIQETEMDGTTFYYYFGKFYPSGGSYWFLQPKDWPHMREGIFYFNISTQNWREENFPLILVDPTTFSGLTIKFENLRHSGRSNGSLTTGFYRRIGDEPLSLTGSVQGVECYKHQLTRNPTDLTLTVMKTSDTLWSINGQSCDIGDYELDDVFFNVRTEVGDSGYDKPDVSFINFVSGKMISIKKGGIGSPLSFTPTSFSAMIDKIVTWLKALFSYDFTFFAISGNQIVEPGSTQTYQIDLISPVGNEVDSDYSDGKYSEHWCSAGLVDKDGNVVNELPFESCGNIWSKSYSVTVPQNLDDHAIVALMVETRQIYDFTTGSWEVVGEENTIIVKESMNLEGTIMKAPSIISAPGSIAVFLAKIWSWLIGLFS